MAKIGETNNSSGYRNNTTFVKRCCPATKNQQNAKQKTTTTTNKTTTTTTTKYLKKKNTQELFQGSTHMFLNDQDQKVFTETNIYAKIINKNPDRKIFWKHSLGGK